MLQQNNITFKENSFQLASRSIQGFALIYEQS